MKLSGLYAISDPGLSPGLLVIDHVRQALEGGARIIQYRDKTSPFLQQVEIGKQLKKLCDDYQAWLIINDSVELALACEAKGVHLGKQDVSLPQARSALGKHAIIGVSCYNDLARAKQMQDTDANYVAFGRFFPSKTKPHAPQADLNTLKQAKKMLAIPIVAIGGITQANAPSLISAGADSLAVIQGVFAQPDIRQAAHDISRLFKV
ncbi:thiamine phosphate synthase [Thiomicrospira microaerophila]|uniref:thiamine phosphate synthase n=1 Tax=Thiomicrospira microaerophila TaxID=406020 RepID=UPI0020105FD3|nr:thiamine phosphate synthase [Thiomicrospira microaerophila]UQB42680.1 thiamine phosphate synthase [Thiomicrospira microaerophila]